MLREEASDWLSKTELAISKGREDLAKGALIEKRRAEEAVEAGNDELSFLSEQLDVLNDEISQLQEKLASAKAKQKELLVREQTGKSRLEIRKKTNRETLNRAFEKFEQYERRLDDLEGQVESYDLGKPRKPAWRTKLTIWRRQMTLNASWTQLRTKSKTKLNRRTDDDSNGVFLCALRHIPQYRRPLWLILHYWSKHKSNRGFQRMTSI
ncbi:PspA/IM30 family protein [Aliamphritea spongicola]|nr:PspA/IM30 family protein [Aliamphritea spongicola]